MDLPCRNSHQRAGGVHRWCTDQPLTEKLTSAQHISPPKGRMPSAEQALLVSACNRDFRPHYPLGKLHLLPPSAKKLCTGLQSVNNVHVVLHPNAKSSEDYDMHNISWIRCAYYSGIVRMKLRTGTHCSCLPYHELLLQLEVSPNTELFKVLSKWKGICFEGLVRTSRIIQYFLATSDG